MSIKEQIEELIDNGADYCEVFEWVEDNTDLDPCAVVQKYFF